MIRFGVCCSPENWAAAYEAGADYIETSLAGLEALSDEDYEAAKAKLPEGIRVEAVNGLLPGTIHLADDKFDLGLCRDYLEKAFTRAAALGVKAAVFGSSASRQYVEGFDRAEADEQIRAFVGLYGKMAAAFGMEATIEPLRYEECNNYNTVAEVTDYVRKLGHPDVFVLADLFHVACNKEPIEDIEKAGSLLRHCHIACLNGRTPPKAGDGYDYAPFFAALQKIGYTGRVSIEGAIPDFARDVKESIAYMKTLA